MFCWECGAKMREGAKFCMKCGATLAESPEGGGAADVGELLAALERLRR